MDQTTLRLGAIATLVGTLLLTAPLSQATEKRPAPADIETGFIGGSVSRATFTEAVVNREPKNRITELPNSKQYIYYFTELKGMAGQSVTHRWVHNGQVMSEMSFNTGSPRWRIWSSLPLQKEWTGTWEVQVINEMDQIIHRDRFDYVQAGGRL